MIDSDATGNFMLRKFATNHRIPGLPKERPCQVTVVDGTPLNQDEGIVKEETLPLMSQIHGKDLGHITFDLVSIPHEAILGIPWLEKVNPSIDWNSRKITIGKEKSKKSTPKDTNDRNLQIITEADEENLTTGTPEGSYCLDKTGIRTAQRY